MAHKIDEALKTCGKILQMLTSHKDSGPFVEAVKWREWGLNDYPKIIKHPMDLGTVQDKLSRGEYKHPKEFKHDVNLVWNNCMTYNVEGSEYYVVASRLKTIFEEKYSKLVRDDDESAGDAARAPSLIDKKMFSQNIYNISSEDLGRVVHVLDQRCESCIKKIDPEDIEIDIDAIDAASFWQVDQLVKECLPGAKKSAAAGGRKSSGGAGGAAGAAASAAEGSKPKKPRTS